jgi:outer membrane protein assembly factor BamB
MIPRRSLLIAVIIVAGLEAATVVSQTPSDWTEWGGPHRNFMVDATNLASSWPADGPRRRWTRTLGEGHSAVIAEGGRLYTMYRPAGAAPARPSQQEAVVALDGATGKMLWEYTYPSATSGVDFSQGAGPHSTPLVAGNRLFAVSSRRELFAIDKTTGRLLWSHDFMKEYGAPPIDRGFACSPLLYNGNVIVTVGGKGQAVAAFNAETGALAWKAGDLEHSPASPLLIDVDGQTQLIIFGGDRIGGMNPATGQLLWSHPHRTDWGLNISTPVWSAEDHLLFISSAYGSGSRAIELRQAAGKTTATERWHAQRMRVHIGTVIRVGDHAYGSSGDFGPAFLTAVNMKTGAVAWQDRAFARAQLLYADGKLFILDEDGNLGVATVSPQGLRVLSRARVLDAVAWTPPTLAGSTLYVRDRRSIVALDVGNPR